MNRELEREKKKEQKNSLFSSSSPIDPPFSTSSTSFNLNNNKKKTPSSLDNFLSTGDKNIAAITVICNDGRVIAGTLRGFDQAVNLILSDCVERVFCGEGQAVELQPLGGLHVIRGDNVAVVGEVDEEKEAGADWGSKGAPPLPPVTH